LARDLLKKGLEPMSTLPQNARSSNALVPSSAETAETPYEGLAMVCDPVEAHRRVEKLQAFIRSVMVKDVDYGIIPGTGTDRPTLLQPGAQKLAEVYGFSHRFTVVDAVKDWSGGFFYFEMKCELTSRADGRFVGEGIGSCNSKESGYAQRWVTKAKLPAGVDVATLKTEQRPSRFNGGTYDVYLVGNADPFSLVNTIQKKACKRAFVHAVIAVTRSAGLFTQDLEDVDGLSYDTPAPAAAQPRWESPGEAREAAPPPRRDPAPGRLVVEMSPSEQAYVEILAPHFVEARTNAELDAVWREANRMTGGWQKASAPFKQWIEEMGKQARAAIGPRPIAPPVKAQGPAPSHQMPTQRAVNGGAR
jgi:hypothetical protein